VSEFTPPVDPAEAQAFEAVTDIGQRLYRLFRLSYAPKSVRIVGGVVSLFPGEHNLTPEQILAADPGSGLAGRAVFTGGRTWTVTTAEAILLNAAGYTVAGGVILPPFTPPTVGLALTSYEPTVNLGLNQSLVLVPSQILVLNFFSPTALAPPKLQPNLLALDLALRAPIVPPHKVRPAQISMNLAAFITSVTPTVGCQGVAVPAGSDLISVMNANPAGTVYCVASGTFAITGPLPFQNGDQLIGALGAQGQRLTIITGSDVTTNFANGSSSAVTVKNLVIEHFNNPTQQGVATGAQTNWIVDNCEIRFNAGTGWHTHDGTTVRNSFIHHNKQMGIGGQGDNCTIESTEVADNNWQGLYDWGWEAGGSKWVSTVNLTVRNCNFHHNGGPGIWTDGSNVGVLYEGNNCHDNFAPGIFHEIGGSCVIRNNTVSGNAWGTARLNIPNQSINGYAGGILISESNPVEVYGNTVFDNNGGIIAIDNDRGTNIRVINLNVHNNDVTVDDTTTDPVAGIYDFGDLYDAYAAASNNHFEANTYHVGADTTPFWWADAGKTWAQWQAFGHDDTGTID